MTPATDTTNELITINGLARIRGSRLRFDDQAADEGIFFLPAAGGSAVKVTAILDNKPSQLSFQVPAAVIADQWFVQVRARGQNSSALRSGQLDTVLTVSV